MRRSVCAGGAGVGGLVLKVTVFEWGAGGEKQKRFPVARGYKDLRTKMLEGARLSIHKMRIIVC